MKHRKILGLALLAVLALSAIAVANASAATIYRCASGGSEFSDAFCSNTTGTKTFKKVAYAAGEKQTSSGGVFELKGKAAAVKLTIKCTTQSSSGTATSSSVIGSLGITFSTCTVPAPAEQHCSVKGGSVSVSGATGTATTAVIGGSSKTAIQIAPASGKPFTEITLEGCLTSGLNNTPFKVEGTDYGVVNNANSTLEFTTASAEAGGLTFAGNSATLTGTSTQSGPSGEHLRVE
jgi:hypothetical protein